LRFVRLFAAIGILPQKGSSRAKAVVEQKAGKFGKSDGFFSSSARSVKSAVKNPEVFRRAFGGSRFSMFRGGPARRSLGVGGRPRLHREEGFRRARGETAP
jgi:hypothetical protein